MKKKLIRLSEDFHHPIHLLIGLIVGVIYYLFNPTLELDKILFYAGLGALVPDVDHLIYLFYYGRSSEYAKNVKSHIRSFKIKELARFLKTNHKSNTGVYTHNMFTILVIYFISISAKNSNHLYLSVFLLSCIFHYVFDIFEDFVYFGKPNPNWYLKFNRSSRKK
jgi:hypothetical protein